MKRYEGRNVGGMKSVTVDGKPLPMEPRLTDDPLTSFSWGATSPGAQQLAYSLLADAVGSTMLWQDFLQSRVTKLDLNHWMLTDDQIKEFCDGRAKLALSIAPDSWTDANARVRPEKVSSGEHNF